MQKGMRVGFFGAPKRCFAGDFEEAVRREWVVLPRNSGGFGLGEGAARRFSARRTVPGRLGKKIFKKKAKNRKIGVREGQGGGAGAPYIGHAGQFLGLEMRPLAALLEVQ